MTRRHIAANILADTVPILFIIDQIRDLMLPFALLPSAAACFVVPLLWKR